MLLVPLEVHGIIEEKQILQTENLTFIEKTESNKAILKLNNDIRLRWFFFVVKSGHLNYCHFSVQRRSSPFENFS